MPARRAGGCASHRRVVPPTSVTRKATVPVGSSAIGDILGQRPRRWASTVGPEAIVPTGVRLSTGSDNLASLAGVIVRVATYDDPHYADDRIVIKKLSVGEMDNNVYVIVDPTTSQSVLVDAADEHERILAALAGTRVTAIWETHGDWDHIRALPPVHKALGVPVAIHPADADSLPLDADLLL